MKIEVYSPTIRRKEMDAVLTAMVEDRLGPGEHSDFLVRSAKEYLGFDYCLALRSPVFALFFALQALNPEAGRGVIISALSPLYYEHLIRSMGLVPLYCDVMPENPLPDPQRIEALLSAKPLCIVYRGELGFMEDLQFLADMGIPVIEDCSQSVFTTVKGKKAGTWGSLSIMGLEERDMITSGGGALLFGCNRRDASTLRSLGEIPPEYLLSDLNAAMAAVQFRESAKNLSRRAEIAQAYIKACMQTRHKRFGLADDTEYNNYAFPLILESGVKDVKAYARRKDIIIEEAFERTLAGSGVIPAMQCPAAASLSLRTVLFPLYPRLGAKAATAVSKLILTLP